MKPFLSVVIPAYNEGPRIHQAIQATMAYLNRQSYSWELLVVDDGSRDDTLAQIEILEQKHPKLRGIRHHINQGKGAAVRTGLEHAQGEAVLFCDADGATPIELLEECLPHLSGGSVLVTASRRVPGAKIKTRQHLLRRSLSTVYRRLCRIFITPGIADITCGFKLLSAPATQFAAQKMRITGWSFDAELFTIARLNQWKVVQVPAQWTDQRRSKVRLVRDVLGSFKELIQIKLNSWQGRYQ